MPSDREAFERWGDEAVSARVLARSARAWAAPDGGVVGYVPLGASAVAIGSPLCARDRGDAVRDEFRRSPAHRPVVFFGRELEEDETVPSEAYVVGEQPWWDSRAWPELVARSRSIRSQVRRAGAKGVRVLECTREELAPGTRLRAAAEQLVDEWLRVRLMAPMEFVAGVAPFEYPEARRYFAARREDQLVGLLVATAIPAKNGWVLDHIVRTRASPNGTAEALVDGAMRAFAESAAEVTLGLAPLAGRVPSALAWVRRLSRGLYDFEGLYEFKAKLRPARWQRVVVEHPGQHALLATIRALRAFAGGSFLTFGFRSLLRCPPPVLRLMSVAVAPWIALLAWLRPLLPYPDRLMLWITFDALFAVALFKLAQRLQRRSTRRRLHGALIVAASVDAFTSFAQHLMWNLPRHNRPIEWVVATASWVVPALVAALLASGLRFREREQAAPVRLA